ncbi:hypothetical protein [Micromonospora inositola]|uniref:Uncharacterized protein n=1 Tax=Micromonospora inositola TaxID=47865 RepID=A0A1C5K4I5_9ACTN|nr:hypothetical protein [Micromonospora inositola]SCG77680.1 hypothetical protein GA0070613_6343 [Micromonospora inositola]
MSTHCYVGTTGPTNPHVVHARFVLFDGYPAAVVPTLARIWAHHARRDAAALAAAVLAHDWECLDHRITAVTTSAFAGQQPVPGVGMTLATSSGGVVDPAEPVSVFPLCQAVHLDAGWIYVIDPATATVTVHTDDGDPIARYRLDACTSHASAHDRAQTTDRASESPRCLRSPVGLAR